MQNTGITQDGSIKLPKWAEQIKQKREKLKESQTTFGKRWDVSHAAVSDWERGITDPPAAVIWWLVDGDSNA